MGYFRTAILLAAMTALFMGIGYLIGGQTGMVIAFLVAAAMNLFAYWNSDKVVLSMYGAREVDEDDPRDPAEERPDDVGDQEQDGDGEPLPDEEARGSGREQRVREVFRDEGGHAAREDSAAGATATLH